MFTTKRYNGKNFKNYNGIGDPYNQKKDIRSTYKNAQFQTDPPKRGQTTGYFNNMTYSTSPYQTTKTYVKQQPNGDRVLAFGSHDARRRDEFTLDIRARQWKEKLKTENDFTKANIMAAQLTHPSTAPEMRPGETHEEARQRRYKEKYQDKPELFQTQIPFQLYDIGKEGGTTPFCNKSKKDTFYDIKRVAASGIRRPGSCPTTYETYGNYDYYPTEKPKYGRITETKHFYDHSHPGTTGRRV